MKGREGEAARDGWRKGGVTKETDRSSFYLGQGVHLIWVSKKDEKEERD